MSWTLKDKSIFIAEDNLQNRVVYQLSLRRYGALVEFERWGPGAINLLRRISGFNIIVLDLMLANGVSGFDLFNEIRALPNHKTTPIVAVSALEPSIALPKARELGFNGFISKPIDKDLFPEQLARIIAGETIWYTGEHKVY